MKNIFKSHGYYYLCQFISTLAVGSIILFSVWRNGPSMSVVAFADIVLGTLIIPLLSHSLIRNPAKRRSIDNLFSLKEYALSILTASVATCLISIFLDLTFYYLFDYMSGLAKKYITAGILSYITISIASGLIFYTIWCLLYIAITSIRDKITLTHQLKEQQLASLMNQVNPHFLFNSLNTIRGMIYEDKDKAAELITQFANLFRYNLSLGKKTTTTLVAELKICQQYLAIESIRLGNRLQLDIDVCPESYPCKIPIMGLLALVENAIKHGIAPLKEGGTLTIRSSVSNNVLTIEVTNPYDQRFVKSGTQIGLVNLEKRVQLLFSGQGRLSTENKDNIFHVSLQLPCEDNNND